MFQRKKSTGIPIDVVKKEVDRLRELVKLPVQNANLDSAIQRIEKSMDQYVALRYDVLRTASFISLLQKISAAANEAASIDAAMQFALDTICEFTGWSVGHLYVIAEGEANVLVPTKIWHFKDEMAFSTFKIITEDTSFTSGIGLPGRVLESRQPLWIFDVNEDLNFARSHANFDIRVKAGFAFPVLVGTTVVAVLEFFSEKAVPPDESLLEIMAQVGTQLGRVVERSRAEEERNLLLARIEGDRAFLEVVLRQLPCGVVIVDKSGNLILSNGQTQQIFRKSPLGILGSKPHEIWKLFHQDGTPYNFEERPLTRVIQKREIIDSEEISIQRDDGTFSLIEVRGAPIHDRNRELIGGVVIFNDISERKQTENKLARVYEDMERALKARKDLLALASHDLKNPLLVIFLNLDLLNKITQGVLTAEKLIRTIRNAANRMDRLIRDFLDLSKIEAGSLTLDLKEVELQSFMHEVSESLVPLAEKKSIQLLIEGMENQCAMFCDPDRLLQVFTNLGDNAIKFSNPNSSIWIRLEQCDFGKVVFSVADSGPGISLEDQDHLFERFWQGGGSSAHRGVGLGLSIVKGIVEAHGGEIKCQSKLGHGTVFTFSIPKSAVSSQVA
jgi:PAS domain S-box-containing protein